MWQNTIDYDVLAILTLLVGVIHAVIAYKTYKLVTPNEEQPHSKTS